MTGPAGPPAELETVRGALAADYEVIRELGRGGMAIVYQARETALDRDVAIKVLPFALAFDAAIVERFQREARTAAQLEHPHIVPIYRVGRAGDVIFFVMKYLRGQSLGDRVLEHGPLPVGEIRRILVDAASALGYAARRGVVHRDVKPDNIMFDEDGRLTVMDFGIARSAADSRLTATGMSLGTPRYMSPEQARTKPVDVRSDLYSLGIVAYECLTGRVPFDGDDAFAILMDHVNRPLPQPMLASDDERTLFAVIERMLAKRPEDRYQTAEELLVALEGGPTVALPGATTDATTGATPATSGARGASRASRAPLAPTAPARALGEESRRDRLPGGARARALLAWVAARSPREWILAGGAAAVLFAGYWGLHFGIMHRSRCPVAAPEDTTQVAAQAAKAGTTKTNTKTEPKGPGFVLLVDAPEPESAGGELDLYYDVCGLAAGAAYSTRVDITRNQSGLRRLFGGGVQPIALSFDERAKSLATRRHREVDLEKLPEGSYTVKVAVTDERGRRRERSQPLQITP